MKVILINCNELDVNYNHTPDFSNKDKQLNWFLNKPKLILDETKYSKINTIINVNYNISQLQYFNYCIYYDDYLQKYIYNFIIRKEFTNESSTTIYLKKDVIQTYLFDMNLTYQSLIARSHLRTRDSSRLLVENLIEDEGLECGEYIAREITNVYNFAGKGGYIVSSSDMLGTQNGGNVGSDQDTNNSYNGNISENLFLFLKGYEQFSPYAYNIGDGVMTIGYGVTNNTGYYDLLYPSCSEKQASEVMLKSIKEVYFNAIKNDLSKRNNPKQNEIDAFVSLSYNCGVNGCKSSPMFQKYIANKSVAECVADWSDYYINAGTIFEEGLRDRRQKEIAIFKDGNYYQKPIYDINGERITDNNGKGYIPDELKGVQSSIRDRIVASARSMIGKPYVWGGNMPPLGASNGTDCSGLIQWAYNDNNIKITRTTYTQINEGREIDGSELKPGDLVFSNFSDVNVPEHVFMFSKKVGNTFYCIEAQDVGTNILERTFYPTENMRFRNLID